MTQICPYNIYVGNTSAHAASGWTQLNGTSKGAGSDFTRVADWLPGAGIRIDGTADPVGLRSGALLRSTDVTAAIRSGTLRLVSTHTDTANTGETLTNLMMDEWATLVSLVSAADGEIYLRFDRDTLASPTKSYSLICRVVDVPEYTVQFNEESATPLIDVNLGLEVLYPYYVDRTGSSQAYANATSTPVSHAITNSGHTDAVGLRAVVDTVDSGTPTVLTVKNTTTGKDLILTVATTITAGDEVSYFATDPRKYAISTTNTAHLGAMAAGDDGFLQRGANTVTVEVDAGQVDVTLYWYDERYTP